MLFPFLFLLSLCIPNGQLLNYKMEEDVKVFHLTAEPISQEFAPGLVVNCWGYNGMTPGPVIEAFEGDRVRIYVTNHLPESTTVHWHGLTIPNKMDGVLGLTQPPIRRGETFVYEFTLNQTGTFMYHPHADEVVQMGMGLMGFFIIHSKNEEEKVDRDYAIMTQEWFIPLGGQTVDPTVMTDFNYFTFNGKVWPATDPLLAKLGEKVRIRLGNLSMNNHPIHLHGHEFTVTRRGAKRLSPSAQYSEVTVDVPTGATRDIEFIANNPGDWAFHCHKTHHLMNGMGHQSSNLLSLTFSDSLLSRIRKYYPNFMPMGINGMESMLDPHHKMATPPHFIPFGYKGPFGNIDMGGMFTILKVREELTADSATSWYQLRN